MEVDMPAKAEAAHEAALDALVEVLKDMSVKVEVRVEAAQADPQSATLLRGFRPQGDVRCRLV